MKRRSTQSKIEIQSILKDSKIAMSHEMLKEAISFEIDRATIYRILNRFCEDGTVHKIVADDGKQYFAWCRKCTNNNHKHNHYHFRCLKCGTVECLDTEITVNLPEGYLFSQLHGVITGNCIQCK